MNKQITLSERINQLVHLHGSLQTTAKSTKVDVGYLSRLRSGEKTNPEKATLLKLGLRRVVNYERLPLWPINTESKS